MKALQQAALLLAGAALVASQAAVAAGGSDQVKRGRYLAMYGGCNDCHTPKTMTPKGPMPDESRLLSGHRADSPLPAVPAGVLGPTQWAALTNSDLTAWAGPWGISFAANLTPDRMSGLGGWTSEQFVKTMRTGKHLGVGRPILPPMPWAGVGSLSDKDLKALFAYLQSLKPVSNQVPAPVPPGR